MVYSNAWGIKCIRWLVLELIVGNTNLQYRLMTNPGDKEVTGDHSLEFFLFSNWSDCSTKVIPDMKERVIDAIPLHWGFHFCLTPKLCNRFGTFSSLLINHSLSFLLTDGQQSTLKFVEKQSYYDASEFS